MIFVYFWDTCLLFNSFASLPYVQAATAANAAAKEETPMEVDGDSGASGDSKAKNETAAA